MADVVVDASAIVDARTGTPIGRGVVRRLQGQELHAPAHFDAEVLSALGRLHRGGVLSVDDVAVRVRRLESAPIQRHPLPPLLTGAWARRANLRPVDTLYANLPTSSGRLRSSPPIGDSPPPARTAS